MVSKGEIMNTKLICLLIAFMAICCGNCKADEGVPESSEDKDIAIFVEKGVHLYDLSPLHAYLSERVENLNKIIATFPRKMNHDQKCIYWMYCGQLQSYKEILSTIQLLQGQNTQ